MAVQNTGPWRPTGNTVAPPLTAAMAGQLDGAEVRRAGLREAVERTADAIDSLRSLMAGHYQQLDAAGLLSRTAEVAGNAVDKRGPMETEMQDRVMALHDEVEHLISGLAAMMGRLRL